MGCAASAGVLARLPFFLTRERAAQFAIAVVQLSLWFFSKFCARK
jgi:hypothetical protein